MGHFLNLPSDSDSAFSRQRTVPRYTFVAVAKVIETASQICLMGRISEISRKGCYVDILNPLPLGTDLNLVISRDSGSLAIAGKVIYVHEGIGMGVIFLDLREEQLAILDSWLNEHSPSDVL